MLKYEALKNAIKDFQPDTTDAPIVYSATEVNSKSFKALLGRNLKSIPVHFIEWIIVIATVVAVVALTTAVYGQVGAPSFGGFFGGFIAVYIFIYLQRTTAISVSDTNLELYFIYSKLWSKFAVYDKISLPYDKITNVKIKRGIFNTSFRFEFTIDEKNYKMRIVAPNKNRRMTEQAENLKHLLGAVEKFSASS